MPARPLSDTTLHLIDAVREALAGCDDVQEKRMFGCHVFMVNGKLCLGVEDDELLVRLPPTRHGEFQEMQNTRELSPEGKMQGYFWIEPNGYATRAQWNLWFAEALAYNPQAKATPPRKRAAAGPQPPPTPQTPPTRSGKRHSIFGDESP